MKHAARRDPPAPSEYTPLDDVLILVVVRGMIVRPHVERRMFFLVCTATTPERQSHIDALWTHMDTRKRYHETALTHLPTQAYETCNTRGNAHSRAAVIAVPMSSVSGRISKNMFLRFPGSRPLNMFQFWGRPQHVFAFSGGSTPKTTTAGIKRA